MQPDRLAASATTHKSLIMFLLRARIVDGGRILIRNEVCPNVTGRAQTFDHCGAFIEPVLSARSRHSCREAQNGPTGTLQPRPPRRIAWR